jgi:hypothetical protein
MILSRAIEVESLCERRHRLTFPSSEPVANNSGSAKEQHLTIAPSTTCTSYIESIIRQPKGERAESVPCDPQILESYDQGNPKRRAYGRTVEYSRFLPAQPEHARCLCQGQGKRQGHQWLMEKHLVSGGWLRRR